MSRWSKARSEKWIKDFIEEHGIVPSSMVREKYNGPSDKELLRHWGSIRDALQACGAPLDEGGGLSVHRYDHSSGVLTSGRRLRREAQAKRPLLVKCALCGWEEFFLNSNEGIAAQKAHVSSHGIEPKVYKWKEPKGEPIKPGSIPGVRAGTRSET